MWSLLVKNRLTLQMSSFFKKKCSCPPKHHYVETSSSSSISEASENRSDSEPTISKYNFCFRKQKADRLIKVVKQYGYYVTKKDDSYSKDYESLFYFPRKKRQNITWSSSVEFSQSIPT